MDVMDPEHRLFLALKSIREMQDALVLLETNVKLSLKGLEERRPRRKRKDKPKGD